MGKVIKELDRIHNNVIPANKKLRVVKRIKRAHVNFVSREELMKRVCSIFPTKAHYLFVSGIGGSGKSELVRKYVSIVENNYDENICMMEYCGSIKETINQGLSFCTDYYVISETEYYSQEMDRQELFYEKMKMLGKIEKSLLVIDNFDNIEDENLQYLLDSNADVIIITRDKVEFVNSINITSCISVKEEIELFKRAYACNDLDDNIIRTLCDVCNKHPMTIVLLASLIAQKKHDLHIIYEKFKTNQKSFFSEEILFEKDRNFGKRQIMRHFQTMLSFYGLSEQQMQILLDISFAYPKELSIVGYFQKKYVGYEGDIKLLEQLNLIDCVTDDIVCIHPLMAENIIYLLEPDMDSCRNVLDHFKEIFENGCMNNYYLTSLVINMANGFNEYDIEYEKMLFQGAKFLFYQSDYESALRVYKYMLKYATEDFKLVQISFQIGLNLKYIGKYKDSIDVYRRTQNICINHLENISFKRMYIPILMGIANNYHMLGEEEKRCKTKERYYSRAIDYYKMALRISKCVDGERSLRGAELYDNMALMYANLQKFEHAYSNSSLARKILKKMKQVETLEMAICYINLGEINKLGGNLEEALHAYKDAERIKQKALPQNHVSHIVTYISIGEILVLLKRVNEAEEYYIKARDIASLKLSNTHIYNKYIRKGLTEIRTMRK